MSYEAEMREEYLNWLYNIVCDDSYASRQTTYHKLFSYLYDTPFNYTMPMDGNRAEDGINLRYRFGRENGVPDYEVASCLDDRDCSVLEMMVALALRCEESIMEDPDVGNRVGQWFWEMIVSLGINMPDTRFDFDEAEKIMKKFMSRTYHKNGKGGLFTIKDRSKDMRKTDIWYQMHYYLSENFGGLDG